MCVERPKGSYCPLEETMPTKRLSLPIFLALLLIVQLACNIPSNSATPDTFATLNGLYTAAAETAEAGGLTVTPGLPAATANGTLVAPTIGANTPSFPSPVPVAKCDAAAFLADVTYPDGSIISLNSTFVKIWRIKNVGTCTW